jgi:hypothetical protein
MQGLGAKPAGLNAAAAGPNSAINLRAPAAHLQAVRQSRTAGPDGGTEWRDRTVEPDSPFRFRRCSFSS